MNDDLPHSKPSPPAYTPYSEGQFDHQTGQFNQAVGAQFGLPQQQTVVTQQPTVCTFLVSLKLLRE